MKQDAWAALGRMGGDDAAELLRGQAFDKGQSVELRKAAYRAHKRARRGRRARPEGRESVVTTATRHPVELRYATASDVEAAPDASRVLLALEGSRGTVGVRGRVREPALFRDALAATLGVLASDLRYRGKDRTAYLAYLMKQGKRATRADLGGAEGLPRQRRSRARSRRTRCWIPCSPWIRTGVPGGVLPRRERLRAPGLRQRASSTGREAAHGSTFLDVPRS